MGGGNGQKSAKAAEKNRLKAEATKSPEERKAAQQKAAQDAAGITCKVCRQGFMINSTIVQLQAHLTSKHAKLEPTACFANWAQMVAREQAAAAAPAAAPVKKKKKKPKQEESLDDLLNAGLSGKKKKVGGWVGRSVGGEAGRRGGFEGWRGAAPAIMLEPRPAPLSPPFLTSTPTPMALTAPHPAPPARPPYLAEMSSMSIHTAACVSVTEWSLDLRFSLHIFYLRQIPKLRVCRASRRVEGRRTVVPGRRRAAAPFRSAGAGQTAAAAVSGRCDADQFTAPCVAVFGRAARLPSSYSAARAPARH